MGTNYKHGFTIIETMLFLAVSGALAVGILAGSNMAINQQRYRDSVNSLQSEIQQQFSEVANVNNSHTSDWKCVSPSAVITQNPGSTDFPRGTSDCVVMGRYIKSYDDSGVSADGTKLYIYSVIGSIKNENAITSTDTEAISNYNLRLSDFDAQTKPLEWDATTRVMLASPTPKPGMFSILILRSPLTGAVRTYIPEPGKTTSNSNLDTKVVIDDNLKRSLKVCVDAPAGVFTGGKMAVKLPANASNQSAVETIAEGSGC